MKDCCEKEINTAITQLYNSIGWATPQPDVTQFYLNRTKLHFPDALEIVLDKTHSIYAVSKTLPFEETVVPDEFIHLEVYDGELSLTGLKKSITCSSCGRKGHIVLLNLRTLVLMQHCLYATFLRSNELFFSEEQGVLEYTLKIFCSKNKNDFPYSIIKPPPRGEWNVFVEMAFSWLLFHEFGHILKTSSLFNPNLPDVFLSREKAIEEIKADIASFKHLEMRMIASNPFDQNLKYLFGGVEFFLRTLSIIKAVSLKDLSHREILLKKHSPHHPSSFQRLKFFQEYLELEVSLGLILQSSIEWKDKLSIAWEQVFNQIKI